MGSEERSSEGPMDHRIGFSGVFTADPRSSLEPLEGLLLVSFNESEDSSLPMAQSNMVEVGSAGPWGGQVPDGTILRGNPRGPGPRSGGKEATPFDVNEVIPATDLVGSYFDHFGLDGVRGLPCSEKVFAEIPSLVGILSTDERVERKKVRRTPREIRWWFPSLPKYTTTGEKKVEQNT